VKSKTIKFAALGLILGSVAIISPAQTPQNQVTMHRQAAGELDSEGWTTATSTDGHYSVKIPTKFSDFSVAHEDPNSIIEKSQVINGVTIQGVRLTTTRAQFRGGKETAKKLFDQLKISGTKPPYKSLKAMKMNGREALEGEIEKKDSLTTQRTVLLDGELFTMIIEYPKTQEAVGKRLAPVYFESVKIE
jgi:hypothetical protein